MSRARAGPGPAPCLGSRLWAPPEGARIPAMRLPSLAAAALLAALLPVPPAAASVWQDEELGLSVDLGTGWDVTTSPREGPGERLGRPPGRLRPRGAEARGSAFRHRPPGPRN